MLERLRTIENEYHEIEARLGDPDVASDNKRFVQLSRRYAELGELVSVGRRLREGTDDLELAKSLLGEAEAVERRGVEVVDPALDRRVDRGDRVALVDRSEDVAEGCGSETQDGDIEAGAAEGAAFHQSLATSCQVPSRPEARTASHTCWVICASRNVGPTASPRLSPSKKSATWCTKLCS